MLVVSPVTRVRACTVAQQVVSSTLLPPADYSYGYTRGWEIIRAKPDQPAILFELHGVSCGEVGTTPCYSAVSIFEGRFIGVKG